MYKYFPDIRVQYAKPYIDYLGLSTLVLAIVPAMLALPTGGSEYPWASPQIIGMFIFAAIMMVLFSFSFNSKGKGKRDEVNLPYNDYFG